MTELSELGARLSRAPQIEILLRLSLEEDIGSGDVTTQASVPPGAQATAKIVARQDGVVCGFPILKRLIAMSDVDLTLETTLLEGDSIVCGDVMATLSGAADAVLTLERTLLNYLQRMSGIATVTRQYVQALGGLPVQILETRKTIPGWRGLDKYAVLSGGGHNHRLGLFDQILAKENHFAMIEGDSFRAKIKRLKQQAARHVKIQVEVENLDEVVAALSEKIELILLDNMSLEDMRQAVALKESLSSPESLLEASGGITLKSIRAVAETGVDRISVGALTHSVPAFDLSLLID